MQSNSTGGFAGFLVQKTIQQYPVRQENTPYNDLQRQNLIMYINKRFTDLRLSNGTNQIPTKQLSTVQITSPNQRQKKSVSPQMESLQSAPRKRPKKVISPDQKVTEMLNCELKSRNATSQLFQEYRLANLKANVQKLCAQQVYDLMDLNHVEMDDPEQVQYFLDNLLKEHPEMDVGNLLHVDIKKAVQKYDQQDKLKSIIEKRITREQMQSILNRNYDSKYEQDFIRVYKESRYDQFEPEYKKSNKLKMATIKKQQEIQDKMFRQIFEEDKQPQQQTSTVNQFYRKHPDKKNNVYISKATSMRSSQVRPQTAHNSTKSISTSIKPFNPGYDQKMKEIIDQCTNMEATKESSNRKIRNSINHLGKVISKTVRNSKSQHHLEEEAKDPVFDKYKRETQFKRKLVNYLLNQVPDKNEILSQKAIADHNQQFIRRCSQV